MGMGHWPGPVQLRATTEFDDIADLLDLTHGGRTRLRFSVNAALVARRFEGRLLLRGLAGSHRTGFAVGRAPP